MKLNRLSSEFVKPFGEVVIGDCFGGSDGNFYIKISAGAWNAVNLELGTHTYFSDASPVKPLPDAEVFLG